MSTIGILEKWNARGPLEALIADWVRQGEEINLLRDLVDGVDSAQSSEEPIRSIQWKSLKTALLQSRPVHLCLFLEHNHTRP